MRLPRSLSSTARPLFTVLLVIALAALGAGCGGAGANGNGSDGNDPGDGTDDDTTPPAAPSGLSAAPLDGAVQLSWTAPDDADTYRVVRTQSGPTASDRTFSPVTTDLSAPRYEDTEVDNGQTYYYRVTAQDAAGNESDASGEADALPFAVPSGLSGTSGDAQVELDWDEATGADRYNVYRSTTSMNGADGEPIASDSYTEYTDTDLSNGTKYHYRVTAVNRNDVESAASVEIEVTPFSDPPDRPSQ